MGDTLAAVYGKMHDGEKAWQTAARELHEETALAPPEIFAIESVNTFYDVRDDAIHHCPSFAAELPPGATIVLNRGTRRFAGFPPPTPITPSTGGQRLAVREILSEVVAPRPSREHLRIRL